MTKKTEIEELDLLSDPKFSKRIGSDPTMSLSTNVSLPLKLRATKKRANALPLTEKSFLVDGTIDLGGGTYLSAIEFRMQQVSERTIAAYCRLRMSSTSRYSRYAPTPFDIDLRTDMVDSAAFYITSVSQESISRQCGDRAISTRRETGNHPINAVDQMDGGTLIITMFNRIRGC